MARVRIVITSEFVYKPEPCGPAPIPEAGLVLAEMPDELIERWQRTHLEMMQAQTEIKLLYLAAVRQNHGSLISPMTYPPHSQQKVKED